MTVPAGAAVPCVGAAAAATDTVQTTDLVQSDMSCV